MRDPRHRRGRLVVRCVPFLIFAVEALVCRLWLVRVKTRMRSIRVLSRRGRRAIVVESVEEVWLVRCGFRCR